MLWTAAKVGLVVLLLVLAVWAAPLLMGILVVLAAGIVCALAPNMLRELETNSFAGIKDFSELLPGVLLSEDKPRLKRKKPWQEMIVVSRKPRRQEVSVEFTTQPPDEVKMFVDLEVEWAADPTVLDANGRSVYIMRLGSDVLSMVRARLQALVGELGGDLGDDDFVERRKELEKMFLYCLVQANPPHGGLPRNQWLDHYKNTALPADPHTVPLTQRAETERSDGIRILTVKVKRIRFSPEMEEAREMDRVAGVRQRVIDRMVAKAKEIEGAVSTHQGQALEFAGGVLGGADTFQKKVLVVTGLEGAGAGGGLAAGMLAGLFGNDKTGGGKKAGGKKPTAPKKAPATPRKPAAKKP